MLTSWFVEVGYPEVIRTDGGPQFRREFDQFCRNTDIEHEKSSPYNPQSNGLAEAAVKSTKTLLKKCRAGGENFRIALLEWRNTPREDGVSPAFAFYGRRLKTFLPALPLEATQSKSSSSLRDNIDLAGATRRFSSAQAKKNFDRKTRALTAFANGDYVRVQCPKQRTWKEEGTVISKVDRTGSYNIEVGGKIIRRNRVFLRLDTARSAVTPRPKNNSPVREFDDQENVPSSSSLTSSAAESGESNPGAIPKRTYVKRQRNLSPTRRSARLREKC